MANIYMHVHVSSIFAYAAIRKKEVSMFFVFNGSCRGFKYPIGFL